MTGTPRSGWRLAPGVTRHGDTTLAGGRPYRVVRLTAKGAAALSALLGATAAPAGGPAARIGARLERHGLLVPPLPPPAPVTDVTVVIPARCAPEPVHHLLARIPAHVPVIVVDDASPVPLAATIAGTDPPARDAAHPRVTVVRHPVGRGAGAARNTGAARATTRWIVFADADVVPPPGWLGALLGVAREPGVVAAAPRILNTAVPGPAGLVETHASALDMGRVPLDVHPGSAVTFVPTAALAVEREAFVAAGGFDAAMKVGEDVDLIWRLARTGRVRYEPRITVAHTARTSLRRALARRSFYGESVGLLERRHPGTVRHADVSLRHLVPWLLGVAVHPLAGVVAGVLTVAATPREVAPFPPGTARRLAAEGQVRAVTGMGRWLARPMLPLTALAAVAAGPRLRRRIGAAVLVGYLDPAVRAALAARRAGTPAVRAAVAKLAATALDDAGYAVGVWRGCLENRTPAALLPRVRR